VKVTGISEFHVNIELSRDDCKVLEAIAQAASTVDCEHRDDAERYQALFQLAIQATRAADYDSAHDKPTA
jgi:hypothetical protein